MAASAIGAGGWLARMAAPGRRGILTGRGGPYLEAGDAGSLVGIRPVAGKQTPAHALIFGKGCIGRSGCKTHDMFRFKAKRLEDSQHSRECCRWLADTLAKQEGGCNMVTS